MHIECEECQRLWREYGATAVQISLDCNLRLAALSQETENIAILTFAAEDALREKESLREAIRKHDAAGHGDRGTATKIENSK